MKSLLVCALVFVVAAVAIAQEPNPVELEIDWVRGIVAVEITRALPTGGSNLPTAVSRARRAIEREAHVLIVDALRTLPFDSLRSLDEFLAENPSRIVDLERIAASARAVDSRSTVDLTSVIVRFELNLYADVIAPLAAHDRPIRLPLGLGWIPTDQYTGILIYAAGNLDIHGTPGTDLVQPALFPGIYYLNSDGAGVERLMEAGYVDPRFLAQWGPVMYTADVREPEFTRRIGEKPLRIIAFGAFGRYPSDVVISREDARQILASDHNRNLISEGRVAFVLSPENL